MGREWLDEEMFFSFFLGSLFNGPAQNGLDICQSMYRMLQNWCERKEKWKQLANLLYVYICSSRSMWKVLDLHFLHLARSKSESSGKLLFCELSVLYEVSRWIYFIELELLDCGDLNMHSAFRKYSNPIAFSTFWYVTA